MGSITAMILSLKAWTDSFVKVLYLQSHQLPLLLVVGLQWHIHNRWWYITSTRGFQCTSGHPNTSAAKHGRRILQFVCQLSSPEILPRTFISSINYSYSSCGIIDIHSVPMLTHWPNMTVNCHVPIDYISPVYQSVANYPWPIIY